MLCAPGSSRSRRPHPQRRSTIECRMWVHGPAHRTRCELGFLVNSETRHTEGANNQREFESTGRRFDPRWAFHRKIGQQIQDRRRFIVKRGVKRIQVEGRTDECRPADNDLDHKSDVRDRWGWSFLSRPPRGGRPRGSVQASKQRLRWLGRLRARRAVVRVCVCGLGWL